MDRIAACRVGLVRTIPRGMEPGSDVANLSLLGYDPRLYHTGRGPFEAASMGVELLPEDVAFRMNLVTLEWAPAGGIVMKSHSSGDISSAEGRALVETLRREMPLPGIRMYPGVAYRHLMVWKNGPAEAPTVPPHDVRDRDMASYLDKGKGNPVTELIRRSWDILGDHPVNRKRVQAGLMPANSIWPWGQGRKPALLPFRDRFGLKGGVISAVDLLNGIGVACGLEPVHVEGATGYLDTNYEGKARRALESLDRLDFMFVHVEAPDEASHSGNVRDKIQAIEAFDEKVVGPVLEGMRRFEDFRVLVASDHLTPIPRKTHTDDPTPFAWAGSSELASGGAGPGFCEASALESRFMVEEGHRLLSLFLGRDATS
jgi:2,3-bisphosphoglycerate-independent phosphoglycerate mutase